MKRAILAAALMLCTAPAASAQTTTFTRQLNIYYGTWNVFIQGSPTPIATQTFVELSDHISAGVSSSVVNAAIDPRLDSTVPTWVDPPGLTNIEWVLGTPENLPAIANFNAAIAALGGSITTDTGFQAIATQTHTLDSFDQDGTTNIFNAEVSYFERNGSVTLPAVNKCPLSHGYWKNNLGLWTVASLTLGTQSYTKPELLAILSNASVKDASVILGRQLIASKLNLLYGSDPAPIAAVIAQADALIGNNRIPFGAPSKTSKAMTAAAQVLDAYNTGQLTTICVP